MGDTTFEEPRQATSLRCLRAVTRVLHRGGAPEKVLGEVARLLAGAMRQGAVARIAIEAGEHQVRTETTRTDEAACLCVPVVACGRHIGRVTASYSRPRPSDLDADRELVDGVANAVGLWIERLEHASELERRHRELAAVETRLQTIIEQSAHGIMVVDDAGRILLLNPAAEHLLGRHASDLLGSEFGLGVAGGAVRDLELLRPDRRRTVVNVHPVAIEWEGEPALLLTLHDITERHEAAEALRRSEARYRALYDDNPTTYLTIDPHGIIRSVNRFGATRLGYAPHELIGRPVQVLFDPQDAVAARRMLETAAEQPDTVHQRELRQRHRDGTVRWVRENARAVDSPEGRRVLVVCEDVTELHALSEKLSWHAHHDPLTGLVNRRGLERRLAKLLDDAQPRGVEHALCYVDLDQFKVVNDTCGHFAGDALLRRLAEALRQRVRASDTLARLGGDEFAVLMEGCTVEQAESVAETLLACVRGLQFTWEGRSFRITASIGLVPIRPGPLTVARALAMADEACFAAKDLGRNRFRVYRESDADLARRRGEMLWASRVHDALQHGRFELHYQRIVPLAGTETGLHLELLLRMRDTDGALVGPGAFLPAAERYNLASALDSWVVEAAFEWLCTHPTLLTRLDLCCINLSGLSLNDETLLALLHDTFDSGRIPGERLCFEITETAAIANVDAALHFIETLKRFGCRFALDDFGIGFSSFAYLRTLPVDVVKIDGTFVRHMVSDPIDLAMVRSIHQIARVMGKLTVAEFVEDRSTREALVRIGVDYAQGFGIALPRPLCALDDEDQEIAT